MKGESYEQAVVRETKEELGIETKPSDFLFIKKFPPTSDLFYFRKFYLLQCDIEPQLSTEHTEAVWVPPEKLFDFVKNDVQAKKTIYEDIPLLIDFVQQHPYTN